MERRNVTRAWENDAMSPADTMLYAETLAGLPWLRHGFTTRHGGLSQVYGRRDDLNLGMTPEDPRETVLANREAALARLTAGVPGPWSLVQTRQVHSATVLALTAEAPLPGGPGDGLVTDVPGSVVGVLAADCVPILLADRRRRVVAAVHAGWRGTAAGIVGVALETMRERFGSTPEDVAAAIGPSIGPCCYETGEEVRSRFVEAFAYGAELFTGRHLDLWEANRRQLVEGGVREGAISVLAACTSCTRTAEGMRFFSHRAESGRTGRMMGLIGIVPAPGQGSIR